MSRVKVDAKGTIAWLQGFERDLEKASNQALDLIAGEGRISIARTTRFKTRSGALQRSIRTEVGPDGFVRLISANANHAGWVEYGNSPTGIPGARIYPRKAKALRFVIDGQVFFRKWVRSNGPLPYMRDAREHMDSVAFRFFEEKLLTYIR